MSSPYPKILATPLVEYIDFLDKPVDSLWFTMNLTGWLMIQCPTPVRIWKVALKAQSIVGRRITS